MNDYTNAPSGAKAFVRRDAQVKCAACGKLTERRMRGQRYCSKRCRQRASREKLAAGALKIAARYPYGADATTPLNPQAISVSCKAQKQGRAPSQMPR